jgi:branched-chain amino acid transport system ATP-binding protein
MLILKNVDVSYGKTKAISNVSLKVPEGQIVTLLGSNGAGKTTTLGAISGFVHPSSGDIIYQGNSILRDKAHKIVKKGIIHVSQERDLFTELSVIENLKLGAVQRKDKDEVKKDLESVFQRFPRLKERIDQKSGTLSGGEQQMLAIGRALMSKPKLLLLDEPTIGLSPIFMTEIEMLLKSLHETGITILLVEQNASIAMRLAQYYYVLRNGEIVAEGETASVPKDVKKFLAKYYI